MPVHGLEAGDAALVVERAEGRHVLVAGAAGDELDLPAVEPPPAVVLGVRVGGVVLLDRVVRAHAAVVAAQAVARLPVVRGCAHGGPSRILSDRTGAERRRVTRFHTPRIPPACGMGGT